MFILGTSPNGKTIKLTSLVLWWYNYRIDRDFLQESCCFYSTFRLCKGLNPLQSQNFLASGCVTHVFHCCTGNLRQYYFWTIAIQEIIMCQNELMVGYFINSFRHLITVKPCLQSRSSYQFCETLISKYFIKEKDQWSNGRNSETIGDTKTNPQTTSWWRACRLPTLTYV